MSACLMPGGRLALPSPHIRCRDVAVSACGSLVINSAGRRLASRLSSPSVTLPIHRHRDSLRRLPNPVSSSASASWPADDAPDSFAKEAIITGTSTETQAVFNVVNVMMGVGLLTLPFALKSSGWVGLTLLWLMGFIANSTAKTLAECANTVARRRGTPGVAVSYEDIALATFGPLGKVFISAMIYVELFGTCCLLFILEGDNLFSLLRSTGLAAKFGALTSSADGCMLVAAAAMIPTLWLPDVSALAFLGLAGVTATCTVAAAVTYTLVSGGFPAGAVTHLANWSTLPLMFGIMTFCYSGHGVFPAIQASMKEPSRFPRVLNIAYLIVAGVCTLVGAAGYYMYGTGSLDVVTFNLPPGFLAVLCASVILVNPVAKFAITLEPVSVAVQTAIANNGAPLRGVARAATRTVLALAVLAAARSVPFLASLMALIGSFLTISVSITLPAICHQILHSESVGGGRTAWNAFVATLGIFCATTGTLASVRSILAKSAAMGVGAATA